jgi:hypothetical protein
VATRRQVGGIGKDLSLYLCKISIENYLKKSHLFTKKNSPKGNHSFGYLWFNKDWFSETFSTQKIPMQSLATIPSPMHPPFAFTEVSQFTLIFPTGGGVYFLSMALITACSLSIDSRSSCIQRLYSCKAPTAPSNTKI